MVDEDRESIQGKNVVAVIAFRESDIYVTDAAPGERHSVTLLTTAEVCPKAETRLFYSSRSLDLHGAGACPYNPLRQPQGSI